MHESTYIITTIAGQWLNNLTFHNNIKLIDRWIFILGQLSRDDPSFHANFLGSAGSF